MAPSRGSSFNNHSSSPSQPLSLSTTLSRMSSPPTREEQRYDAADPIIPIAHIKSNLSAQHQHQASEIGAEPQPKRGRVDEIVQEGDEEKRNLTNRSSSLSTDKTLSSPSHTNLAAGCTYGPIINTEYLEETKIKLEPELLSLIEHNGEEHRILWVDFPPLSPQNPFYFSQTRKYGITIVATLFTLMTSMNVGAFSIGMESLTEDLGCTREQAAIGLGIYNFGFAAMPLILAPLSEEFGRRWTYVIAVILYLIFHIMIAVAKNLPTMLLARVLQGCSGSVAATLVGGTIADIYIPADRGLPSAIFAFSAIAGSGLGPFIFCWVESNPKLQWRWIWWIQAMMIAALIIPIFLVMRETRESIILRRRAKKLRKERGLNDGGRYTARSEVGKVNFTEAMKTSSLRAITFLLVEPILLFFSIWMGIGWGVLYTMVTGLSYNFKAVYGFTTNQVGLAYISITIGALFGFGYNFLQDAMYRRKVEEKGIEARLYAPMVAGLTFAVGCFIFSFTSISSISYIVPCFGIVVIIAAVFTIYISAFVYISECYGSYASSAIAAQSFLRNSFGGAFTFFTLQMYDALTPKWTTFTWGCVALLLSAVPFVAFYFGPKIRARSKYSKILMKEEQERIMREKEILDGLG
ncbi:hypothetical protein I302_100444 [Kwoniella bestiolae CBS 10118]|uniref:Major facilitator superfamily (MFS) profile domain-containing protein n=1 Tax=Kwoniella bestiolae CBS 10118 TaxID=1296100 RepID=A0A1B9G563_9TREE|nr:hypothetical protein I302_03820 [Kwoniella bestiolae CBS 10118]OCF26142.1 hypothetical protein I302_03820 [Kwoniella bestiolae CBS 10118]